MNQAYNPRRHGRTSETDPENDTVREEWEHCRALNAEHGGEGWTWIPTGSIYLRDDLQPRIESGLDTDTARRYADAFDLLPPVLVQRGTLHLIDGRHRVRAAYLANPQRYYIKATELDVADEEMIWVAVEANSSHGRGSTQKERLYWAQKALEQHPEWADALIAKITGCSRQYVWEKRGKNEAAAATKARVGRDGKTRDVSNIGTNHPPQLVSGLQVDGDVTSSDESKPESSPASNVVPYKGTHFPGGKPCGYFAEGSSLVDLSTGEVVTLVRKGSEWATVQYEDGDQYDVHVVKDVRFAPAPGAPADAATAPAPTPVTNAVVRPERVSAVVDAITGLANAINDQADADEVARAMELAMARYVLIFAEPALGWFSAFVESLDARVGAEG